MSRSRPSALGRQLDNSDWLDRGIRIGLVAYGIVHLMIGWLALQLALGQSQGQTSNQGAMNQLAQQPLGGVLVWLVTRRHVPARRLAPRRGGRRAPRRGGRATASASAWSRWARPSCTRVVGVSAAKVAMNAGSGGGKKSDLTATIMGWPAGQWIVGRDRPGRDGVRREPGAPRVDREVPRAPRAARARAARPARPTSGSARPATPPRASPSWSSAACSSTPGYTHKAKKAGGLDHALHTVLQQPFGPVLLGLIAVGIACYGLFCFARARHLSR